MGVDGVDHDLLHAENHYYSTVSRDVGMTRLSDVSAVFVDQLTSLYKELTRRRLSLACCSSIYNSITYSTSHSTVAPSTQYYAQ